MRTTALKEILRILRYFHSWKAFGSASVVEGEDVEEERRVGAKGQEVEGRDFKKKVKMCVTKTEDGKV